jgi:rod shape-determining protein MreC
MFSSRRFERSTGLFAGLLAISFLIMTFDVRSDGAGLGDTLREGAQTLFSPLQRVADAITRPVVGFIDGISDIAGLREENERLRERLDELTADRERVLSLQNQVEELQKILDVDPPGNLETVAARIFSPGVTDFDHIRWIDKGSDDGVVSGQAVVDEDGLVGRIDFVTDTSARVRLITDPRLGIGVRNLVTNETGWVEGTGSEPLRLKMFNAVEPVSRGDLVVTDGTRFPPNLTVGTVLQNARSEAGFQLISSVDPAIDVSRLDFVKVIVGWSPLDVISDDEEQPEINPIVTEQ